MHWFPHFTLLSYRLSLEHYATFFCMHLSGAAAGIVFVIVHISCLFSSFNTEQNALFIERLKPYMKKFSNLDINEIHENLSQQTLNRFR